jgi:hypothetical protein
VQNGGGILRFNSEVFFRMCFIYNFAAMAVQHYAIRQRRAPRYM